MVSHAGRFVVVFNGEIYNHRALRLALGADVAWRGHSDTETLLEGIERWGLRDTLERAVGMFAFALWDRVDGMLSLVRDRLGEKPLYYAYTRDRRGFAFASEIKALRLCPGLDLALDEEALRGFVRFGFIGGSRSSFRCIRKLPPASVLQLRDPGLDSLTPARYWSLPVPVSALAPKCRSEADDEMRVSELKRLLESSVGEQMLSDVPLGAFLSGGIDSSLIVAVMQRISSRPIRTFTMGYDDEVNDELRPARQTATLLGTDHTELRVTPQDVLGMIPRLPAIYDEPFADASQVPTLLLSRLTRQHVTVALTGDAGDELFGGYNRYLVAARVESIFDSWPVGLRRAVGRAMLGIPASTLDAIALIGRRAGLKNLPPSLGEKIARLAKFIAASNCQQAYLGALSQWTGEDSDALLEPAPLMQLAQHPEATWAQQMMCWDLQSYLPDDILVKVDRAAMACSLETRVPLLDHRIVEFALARPLHQKIRDGQSKWLLRKLLAQYLPSASFSQPKQGFTVPLDVWLRGPLRDWAEELLSPSNLARSGLLRIDTVRRVWSEHLDGRRNHQRALWTILMLQGWLAESAQVAAENDSMSCRRPALISQVVG